MFTLNNIDLVVYDFDGVMTDNKVIVSEDGVDQLLLIAVMGWQ